MQGGSDQPPQKFSDIVYKLLANALDYGITEAEFWEMTLAELERAVESKRRVEKLRAQEKATLDYILADLMGYSFARTQSSANKMPEISAAYPTLFDSEEIKAQRAEKQTNLSALRFKLFAQSYNNKFKGAEVNND